MLPAQFQQSLPQPAFAYLAPSYTRSQASALKAGFGWIKRDELGSRTTPDEGGHSSDRQPEAPDIERLRFYAEQFNTVEVDSTFYALPTESNAKLSAERTPAGFVFNIKPFALMTQHPAEVSRLPEQLRGMLPAEEQSNQPAHAANYASQGVLERISGLLLARPMKYSQQMTHLLYSEVRRILAEFGRVDIPVVANLDFGHTSPQMVLPIGCRAAIDPQAKRVAILEPAVT
jgi:hypothetical protein